MPKRTIPEMTKPKQKMIMMEVAISVVFLVCDHPRQENDTHANPKAKNARNPNSYISTIVMIHKEPQSDTPEEAGEGCD